MPFLQAEDGETIPQRVIVQAQSSPKSCDAVKPLADEAMQQSAETELYLFKQWRKNSKRPKQDALLL